MNERGMGKVLPCTATRSLLWSAVLAGCGTDSPPGYYKETFVDENGVEVHVHNDPFPSSMNGWWVSNDAVSTVSESLPQGDTLHGLGVDRSVARLTSGALAAVYALGQRVAFWNDQGDVVRIVESGEGPGSIGLARAIFRNPAGGGVIWDDGQRRAHFTTSDGEFLESVPLESPMAGWGKGGLRGVLTGGRLVTVTHHGFRDGSGGEARDRFTVTLLDADGSMLATVDDFEGPLLLRGPPGVFTLRHLEYDPMVLVSDSEIFVFDGDRGEVRIYNADGQRVRIIRRQNPERNITRQRRETHLRELEEAFKEMGITEGEISKLQKNEWPAQEGSFISATVTPDGRILVAEPGRCVQERYCWNVYGHGGEYEGSLDMAIEFLPMFMDDRELVGLAPGPFGEGEIQIFRVERR